MCSHTATASSSMEVRCAPTRPRPLLHWRLGVLQRPRPLLHWRSGVLPHGHSLFFTGGHLCSSGHGLFFTGGQVCYRASSSLDVTCDPTLPRPLLHLMSHVLQWPWPLLDLRSGVLPHGHSLFLTGGQVCSHMATASSSLEVRCAPTRPMPLLHWRLGVLPHGLFFTGGHVRNQGHTLFFTGGQVCSHKATASSSLKVTCPIAVTPTSSLEVMCAPTRPRPLLHRRSGVLPHGHGLFFTGGHVCCHGHGLFFT